MKLKSVILILFFSAILSVQLHAMIPTEFILPARYYDSESSRFISPDFIAENPNNPQSFNRYSYVSNNPITYIDPLGLWRIGLSFHAGFGGHLFYDSDNGRFRAGLGGGMGGGASVGNNNWDIGYSNDNYVDFGYDNKMQNNYIEGKYGSGLRGPNGETQGYGVSGTYYLQDDEYQVGAGAGYYGVGINGGYSSFGNGSYTVGLSAAQVGATYDTGTKKMNYSYTLDPKALEASYKTGVEKRKYNGYGPEGYEKQFFIVDWIGTVMAGSNASDVHDGDYRTPGTKKGASDLRLLTNMAQGSVSNALKSNGLFRMTIGLAISPIYYGAVAIGGGSAFNAGHANAR